MRRWVDMAVPAVAGTVVWTGQGLRIVADCWQGRAGPVRVVIAISEGCGL